MRNKEIEYNTRDSAEKAYTYFKADNRPMLLGITPVICLLIKLLHIKINIISHRNSLPTMKFHLHLTLQSSFQAHSTCFSSARVIVTILKQLSALYKRESLCRITFPGNEDTKNLKTHCY